MQHRSCESKHLMSVSELAERWGCCPRTIYRMVARRELAAVKMSKVYLFDPVDVENYEAARKTGGGE